MNDDSEWDIYEDLIELVKKDAVNCKKSESEIINHILKFYYNNEKGEK